MPQTVPKTLVDAIRSNLLGSMADYFADVTLISSDNKRIPAVRALLAVRSDYFKSQFFSDYADCANPELTLPHPASTLHQVLNYAYTDDCPLLHKAEEVVAIRKSAKRKPDEAFAEHIRSQDLINLIDLIIASDYCGIHQLADRAATALGSMTLAVPKFACLVLEATRRHAGINILVNEVLEKVMRVLRRTPHECFLVEDFRRKSKRPRVDGVNPFIDSGVLMLGKDSLAQVLKDPDLFTSESYLFQVLYFWATDGKHLSSLKKLKPPVKDTKMEETEQGRTMRDSCEDTKVAPPISTHKPDDDKEALGARWNDAKELVKYINMERMKPSFIQDYVEVSGLVHHDALFKVYQQQALEAERGRPLFDSFRGGSLWDNGSKRWLEASTTYVSRCLTSPWLSGGRHEWTFRLDKDSDCTWFGVSAVQPGVDMFFASTQDGWAYASRGLCSHNHKMARRVGPMISEGFKVKMVLNLLRQGTLTVLVEGTESSYLAFERLKLEAKQFKPAVYLKRPAAVTLVSEKHTME